MRVELRYIDTDEEMSTYSVWEDLPIIPRVDERINLFAFFDDISVSRIKSNIHIELDFISFRVINIMLQKDEEGPYYEINIMANNDLLDMQESLEELNDLYGDDDELDEDFDDEDELF